MAGFQAAACVPECPGVHATCDFFTSNSKLQHKYMHYSYKLHKNDHYTILHMSQQHSCCDMCKIRSDQTARL